MVAVKNLPLVLVAIVMNTMPLFTALFGYFILREVLMPLEKLCLVLSFAGVAIIVTGNGCSSKSHIYNYTAFTLTALILNPVLNSLVTIILRTLKNCSIHA